VKIFKFMKPLDERGVSIVLGAILLLGIGIAVGSLVYSEYVQSSIHSSEASHMEEVKTNFIKLQTQVASMKSGDTSSVGIPMDASFPFFVPTKGQIGSLSLQGTLYSPGGNIQIGPTGKGYIYGAQASVKSPGGDYLTINEAIFQERFFDASAWIMMIDNDDLSTSSPGLNSGMTHTQDGSNSVYVSVSAQRTETKLENAYWVVKNGINVPGNGNDNISLSAWLNANINPNIHPDPSAPFGENMSIDYENQQLYQPPPSVQQLYAHQENTTISSGDNYHLLENVPAENTGTNLSVSTADNGRKLWGSFVYPLTGFNTILASTWNVNYRSWLSVPPIYDNVSGENVYQGGTSNFSNAQAADNSYENIFESDYGAAKFDNDAYVSSYAVTTGSLDNFDNQKQEDGGWSTLSMAYVSTDNNITNGTFTTNDTGWTFADLGNSQHAWTSSGYVNGGSENIYTTTKNKSGEGYIYQSLPTAIPAGSTVILSYAWLKDYKVAVPTQQDIIVTLVKPSGATVNIDTQSGAPAAYNTWYTVNKDISSYFTETGTYQIRMRYLFTTVNTNNVEANAKFDEVRIIENNYRLDVFENVGGVVAGNSYNIQLNFRLDNNKENFRVQVQNASNGWDNFDNVITYSGGNWTTWENNVNPSYIVGNTVRLRFVDNSGKYPLTTNLQLDYVRGKTTTDAAPVFLENVQQNITGIPSADNYQLQTGYYTAGNEAFSVYLYNFTTLNWDNVGVLTGGSSGSQNTFTYGIDNDHISSGNVYVRYVQPNPDTILSSLMVDYTRVKISYVVVAQASVDILIRKADNTIRKTENTNVALANLTLVENTLQAPYPFGGYAGFVQSDYLEIDYYCNVLSAGPGGTAYLKIDNNSLASVYQTRVENVKFGYSPIPLSSSWKNAILFVDNNPDSFTWIRFVDNSHLTKNQIRNIENLAYIRVGLSDLASAGSSAFAQVGASLSIDEISLLDGPPFDIDVTIKSATINNPDNVESIVENIGFWSIGGSAYYTLQIENFANPGNPWENLRSGYVGGAEVFWGNVLNNPRNYIENTSGTIMLRLIGHSDNMPFDLALDWVDLEANYPSSYIDYYSPNFTRNGRVEFDMLNYSYPDQTYIYEDGAVILYQRQENSSTMVSEPLFPLAVAIPRDNDNIEVNINTILVDKSNTSNNSVVKGGWSTISVQAVDNYYRVPLSSTPSTAFVEIDIDNSPLTSDAWYDYLNKLAINLNAQGANAYVQSGENKFSLIIQGKVDDPLVNDIYYSEKVQEIVVGIA
jgi:hypothetical protein